MGTIESWLAPWAGLYGDHTLVAMVVMTMHLLALLVGGGFAVSADHATLRVHAADRAARDQQLERLAVTHAIVIAALAVSLASGLLLAAADVRVFISSPLFWIKLGIVAALLINGGVLRSVESRLHSGAATEHNWKLLTLVSRISLALWIGAVIAGVALTDFAG